MKVIILQENLTKGLNIVSRVIGGKTNLPILENILISAKEEGKLKLTATNLETSINIFLPAKIEKKGDFALPAKDINEFIASLPAETITLEKDKEKLKVSLGKHKATFNGVSTTDFPQVLSLANMKKPVKFSLGAKTFVQALKKVCFSAAVDETRPVLTGVRLGFTNDGLQMVATDGYRLSLKKIKLKNKIEKIPVLIIPARALMELEKIIDFKEEEEEKIDLAITQDNNQILISFKNIEILSRLIEGEFPDFNKIVPEKGETKVVVDTQEFNQAIKAASVFARRSANIIKLQIKNDKLTISANAPEIGGNEVELDVKQEGKEVKIAFNFRFLQEFLNTIEKDSFYLELTGSLRPALFKEQDGLSGLHVIMPVRLQEAKQG